MKGIRKGIKEKERNLCGREVKRGREQRKEGKEGKKTKNVNNERD